MLLLFSQHGGSSAGLCAVHMRFFQTYAASRVNDLSTCRCWATSAGAVTCDAHHMTDPHPEGLGVSTCIELALKDAKIERDEVLP